MNFLTTCNSVPTARGCLINYYYYYYKSLSSSVVPRIWKDADVIRVPKISQPESESNTRPISLIQGLSKILEDFVVRWMLDDLNGKIDPWKFGCLKGLSTTFCLTDMLHTWLSHLDTQNKYIRVCFLDFSKAFDRISYNILINKLIDMGVRRSLIQWIINILTDRRQRVKICRSISNWLPVTAGVPQVTKLGPILFLVMVNNLKTSTPDTRMWKFVDDSTVSKHLTGNIASGIQPTLNHIESWCSDNWMILIPKKCKQLRICFLKTSVELQPLEISGSELQIVQSHKALGLTIQTNLKWDEHIRSIIAKASKRFHILRI